MHGGIPLREIIWRIHIKLKWCKPFGRVMWKITSKKLSQQEPICPDDFSEVYSFKYSNRYEREVSECMCKAISARVANHEYQLDVERAREMLSRNEYRLSSLWLSDVEVLLLAGGLFILAGDVRQLRARKLLQKYKRKRNIQYFDSQQLYVCYMNRGEYEKAVDVLNRTGKLWREKCRRALPLMLIATRMDRAEFSSLLVPNREIDKVYFDMISGKNVAVIGPATGTLDVDDVLKNFDVKIRINFRGHEYLNEDGRKCGVDISYYNASVSKTISETINFQFLEYLTMSVFKKISHDFQGALLNNEKGRRKAGSASHLMFQGHENMVQLILMDLFYFSPAQIKLFNFNLYLSRTNTRHQRAYSFVNTTYSREEMWFYNAVPHNLISSYEIMKLWYDAGFFEADEELAEILTLGLYEYLQRMERLE